MVASTIVYKFCLVSRKSLVLAKYSIDIIEIMKTLPCHQQILDFNITLFFVNSLSYTAHLLAQVNPIVGLHNFQLAFARMPIRSTPQALAISMLGQKSQKSHFSIPYFSIDKHIFSTKNSDFPSIFVLSNGKYRKYLWASFFFPLDKMEYHIRLKKIQRVISPQEKKELEIHKYRICS